MTAEKEGQERVALDLLFLPLFLESSLDFF